MKLENYYWYYKSIISPEDCQKIIDAGENQLLVDKKAGVNTNAYTHGNKEKQSNPEAVSSKGLSVNELSKLNLNKKTYIRDSQVSWLNDTWLYDLIIPLIEGANIQAGWRWNLNGSEAFQFTKYNKDGLYGWHEDGQSDWHAVYKRYIPGISKVSKNSNGQLPSPYTEDKNLIGKVRKISMTLNLNKPGEYTGGDLKFDFGLHTEEKNRFHICEEIRPQGSLVVFPSFLKHCVTPLTKGTRYSLVLWTLGEPWA